jgi:hypothetical protein
MTVSADAWLDFIDALKKVNTKAGNMIQSRLIQLGGAAGLTDVKGFMDYAYAVASRYGEAAAAIACEMYDAVAAASGVAVPAAEPASTATYGEVAKAVNGTLKYGNDEIIQAAIVRLVKMASVDTTMQNALRDGAEWAWIPHGDTCAFCITLASRGWQKASKEAIKDGHAEHIHANCDCTYAIRFGNDTKYAGYDPGRYLRIYDNAEGYGKEKINSMRRDFYAQNREEINAQKRSAYEKRKELNASSAEELDV